QPHVGNCLSPVVKDKPLTFGQKTVGLIQGLELTLNAIPHLQRSVAAAREGDGEGAFQEGLLSAMGFAGWAGLLAKGNSTTGPRLTTRGATRGMPVANSTGGGTVPRAGQFSRNDVVLGRTKIDDNAHALDDFAGEAVTGNQLPVDPYPLLEGESLTEGLARNVLKAAREHVDTTGGRIRFNLAGVDLDVAFGKEVPTTTSAELRGILNDPELLKRTDFFDEAGILDPGAPQRLQEKWNSMR